MSAPYINVASLPYLWQKSKLEETPGRIVTNTILHSSSETMWTNFLNPDSGVFHGATIKIS